MSREAFLFARSFVERCGYSHEIAWQDSVSITKLAEEDFLREYAWVVLASGMREAIIRAKFPLISGCFYSWKSANAIAGDAEKCVQAALRVFRHEPKMRAISFTARLLAQEGFFRFKRRVEDLPLPTLRALPYIGPVTQFHLAKNIGVDVAKPDRHLTRIAQLFRYSTVQAFCQAVATKAETKVAIVDLVFWRFATLDSKYLERLHRFV